MKRYRHQFLTFRQMLFVNCLMWTFFNKSASARMAGYSKHSSKWQGYRLIHQLPVMIYLRYCREQIQFCLNFPHAHIIIPDRSDLKRRLSECNIKVRNTDIMRAIMNTPSTFNVDAMSKDNQHLAGMLQKSMERDSKRYDARPSI